MSLFTKMSIKRKFMCVLALSFILLLAVGIVSYTGSKNAIHDAEKVAQEIIPSIEALGEIKAQFKEFRISAIKYGTASSKELAEFQKKFNADEILILQNAEIVGKVIGKEKVDILTKLVADYKAIANGVLLEVSKKGDSKEAAKIVAEKLVPIGKKFDEESAKIQKSLDDQTIEFDKLLMGSIDPTTNIVLLIVVILLNVLCISVLANDITLRVQNLTNGSSKVADGDLSEAINPEGRDEIGKLGYNFSKLVENLHNIITNIKSNIQKLDKSSSEIKDSSAIVEEEVGNVLNKVITLSSASEEMVATSQEIASNCNLAAMSAEDTEKLAKEGMVVVQETVTSIKSNSEKTQRDAQLILQLGQRTKEINSIIDTIQNIADQTNLLALNAAIEAARAGEHGRGFAVVADEVRSLAVKTSSATSEINSMIFAVQNEVKKANDSIIETVDQMNNLATNANNLQNTLSVITNKVGEVNSQITQIAAATEQQTGTSQTMSANLQDVSTYTEQISNVVRGTLELSETIRTDAQNIDEATSGFRI